MLFKKTLTILGTTVLIIFLLSNSSYADNLVDNGEFSNGLVNWTTEGDVFIDSEYAVLGDNGVWYSLLFQPTALDYGTYTLEFDFKNSLSPDITIDPWSFYDSFYTTIYFIDDINSFSLETMVYDDAIELFSMDSNGVFDNYGTISSSILGPDWVNYSTYFANEYTYTIITFEFLDFNCIDNDSQVFIDNVSINPVPEPATLMLLGSGLAGLGVFSRRKKR